jgi:serine/threonine protein kinase/formylglycine-generating enzyme required for sulfatase activity
MHSIPQFSVRFERAGASFMVDPPLDPTEDRRDRPGEETLDLYASTEADDPAAPRVPAGEPTDRDEAAAAANPLSPVGTPDRIGRYLVKRRVGYGGFGTVFLAHDEQLDRLVAVKVPHARLVPSAADAGLYLAEARAVAQLDHPNIVPVFDVGSSRQFPCYIVSKFIDGEPLAARIRRNRPGWIESAELVARIAEALDHAHERGFIHRDVKPGNILIDPKNIPFVVDFGLALRDGQHGQGLRYVGTPAYMSPEQAWGEGHRVDRRSDVFSLGVVFYELLCGVRPFAGPGREALMIQMTTDEPRPPCQVDGSIPGELQRICLKALAKRASDRYLTALAMAEDIRHFLAELDDETGASRNGSRHSPLSGPPPGDTAYFLSRSRKIVPKGLRSYSERDADFFVELLPGPRDRDGLPESLRFWKQWVEHSEPGPASSVGLIYGPSGCGKSSLVKAGLIPRLARKVLAVYVEATPEETETRLLAALRRRCAALPGDLTLKDSLAALRRGQGLPADSKVLLVLDQFEQWLHARRGEEAPALVQDLRQCDGDRVQCLVMVRDDFWMAATRFMKALEVPLLEGLNSSSVDLFDPTHARRVLAAFGKAYGKLDDSRAKARDRDAFLDEAVQGLAQEGKVVCVRLALFAEMMKSREWTRAALGQVGGARGVGYTFLEENFGAASAPPAHLRYQQAARAVLGELLPEAGTDIKGHMRCEADLLEVSGYAERPEEFEKLIRILDAELRLITPTDPEGMEADSLAAASRPEEGSSPRRYYQLTHDYLVHSLSDWLTRKQRESRQGRASLLLQERASLWASKPEVRFLPSVGEWLSILLFTKRGTWSDGQHAMMSRAGRRYGLIGGLIAAALALVIWGGFEAESYFWAQGKVGSLRTASTSQVPTIVDQLAGHRRWADPMLRSIIKGTSSESPERLHASLGLLPSDPSQVDFLTSQLLTAEAADVKVIGDALAPYQNRVSPRLWLALRSAPRGDKTILPTASALALYTPDDLNWHGLADKVAHELASISSVSLEPWLKALRPARAVLITPLIAISRDASRPASERILATDVLAAYAADRPKVIADLLVDAEPGAFSKLMEVARSMRSSILPLLQAEIARQADPPRPGQAVEALQARDRLAERQARAAIALCQLDADREVLPMLAHSTDPQVRSYMTLWFKALGTAPKVLAGYLDQAGQAPAARPAAPPRMDAILFDRQASTRRAIVLALGHYELRDLAPELSQSLITRMVMIYRNDPDSGAHSAAEWTLRRWGQEARLRQIDLELIAQGKRPGDRWFKNSLGMTLAVVEGPVEFQMGSPDSEPDHESNELLHRRVIPRRFALGTTEVTVGQFKVFLKEKGLGDFSGRQRFSPDPHGPISSPSWYEAAEFCDWLSRKENLQPCYAPLANGQYGPGMKIPADARIRSGYRLPTEAEWEYGCRAGTLTGRYYGSSPARLGRYAWFNMNSDGRSRPSGELLPNDLGLFDMIGNVYEWCEDRLDDYRPRPDGVVVDRLGAETVLDKDASYILRGGSFGDVATHLNSAHRIWNTPQNQLGAYGFRIARTIDEP